MPRHHPPVTCCFLFCPSPHPSYSLPLSYMLKLLLGLQTFPHQLWITGTFPTPNYLQLELFLALVPPLPQLPVVDTVFLWSPSLIYSLLNLS